MQKMTRTLWLLLAVLLLAACSPQSDAVQTPGAGPDAPVSSDDTPVPTEEPQEGEFVREENAIVEEIDILMMESFPLQVNVHVVGLLRDGCTTVADTWSEQVDENTFELHILTQRPKDAMCTQALVPFEENVSLDVNGLPAGTYTAKVYDLSETFTFEQDNVLPE